MKIKFLLTGAVCMALAVISGCFSPDIEIKTTPGIAKFYGAFPSFEVDIAGITEAEANQLKSLGVDSYFPSTNPFRDSLKPATVTFSRNTLDTAVLKSDDPHWEEWDKKDAKKLLLIVNLPQQNTVSKDPVKDKFSPAPADGRIYLMDYPGSSLIGKTLHFQVTSNGITKTK